MPDSPLVLQLPKFARKYFEGNQQQLYRSAEHFGLKWNKLVYIDSSKDSAKQKPELLLKDNDGKVIFDVNFDFNTDHSSALIHAVLEEQDAALKQMDLADWTILQIADVQSLWRMIIGLGNTSVYEVSMTLHHSYGFPYVPATSLKGVLRNWIIRRCFSRREARALENSVFVYLFGETEQKGKVIFFDAFPQDPPKLKADVMNVMYPNYYNSQKAPGDYQAANPVYFLSLDKRTRFKYCFALPPGIANQKLSDFGEDAKVFFKIKNLPAEARLLDLVNHWMRYALYYHGLGSKTSRGYGRQRAKK